MPRGIKRKSKAPPGWPKVKRKRGEKRADGYYFKGYAKTKLVSGEVVIHEMWASPAAWKKRRAYVENRRALHREYIKKHYQKNAERYRKRARDWYAENTDRAKTQKKNWSGENKEKVKLIRKKAYLADKEKNRKQALEWKRKNKARLAEIHKQRMAADPQYRLASALRGRLKMALKRGGSKSAATLELIGCSLAELQGHLERQFTAKMTWRNHGKYWHIDHIRPLASFDLTEPAQQRQACHWSNLQPLTVHDNLSKGDKIEAAKLARSASRATQRQAA